MRVLWPLLGFVALAVVAVKRGSNASLSGGEIAASSSHHAPARKTRKTTVADSRHGAVLAPVPSRAQMTESDKGVGRLADLVAHQPLPVKRRIAQLKLQQDIFEKWWQLEGASAVKARKEDDKSHANREWLSKARSWHRKPNLEGDMIAEGIPKHGITKKSLRRIADKLCTLMTAPEAAVFEHNFSLDTAFSSTWDWDMIQRQSIEEQVHNLSFVYRDAMVAVALYRKYGNDIEGNVKRHYMREAKKLAKALDEGSFETMRNHFTPEYAGERSFTSNFDTGEDELAYIAAYDYGRLAMPKAMAHAKLPELPYFYRRKMPVRDSVRRYFKPRLPRWVTNGR